ncbi:MULTISPECIES: diguanylate cyclase domain-containing protein [Methylobacterium]|uniref:Diguanylate cyclase n=1 Tax=Methylobacterium bullatum TaxID=570505 RepID=A0AAV4ZBQ5_9HYPH|nr:MULTISPECIES: diguanylate cyclase [Methylobacterium]KQO41080.1 hypothetical protein ASF08_15020 [Methylobacterium sp. Leaf85]MBD8904429.1 sensor domain-containing diguanylate cyclase [Methylobacterium bullatum]GJD41493.1 hypothetical protein OICFNHDK_3976 [Methylobacterium bullatum]
MTGYEKVGSIGGLALPILPAPEFSECCRIARALFNASAATVCLRGEPRTWTDLGPDAGPQLRNAAEMADGRPDWEWPALWCGDTRTDPAFTGWLPAGNGDVGFFASAPFGPDQVGRLSVLDARPQAGSPEKSRLLTDLAAMAGQIYDLARAVRGATEREAEFRHLAEMSTDTIIRGNLDGIRLYVSPSIRTLLGYEPEELVGRKAIDIAHPDDIPNFGRFMQNVRDGHIDVAVIELRLQHKNGAWVWMEASLRLSRDPDSQVPNGYVVSVRDVGRRKLLEERLEQLASFDPLTGLPNRSQFSQRLQSALDRSSGTGESVALFYMDLDNFKGINDTMGHAAGDSVLRVCAARLRAELRQDDFVARLGGDEFTAILTADESELPELAQRLVSAVGAPIPHGGQEFRVGLSVGIARAPRDGTSPDVLLSAADRALYRAKAAGRNTFRF